MKTAEEIRAEINRLNELRYYEGMADYPDWKTIYKLRDRIKELETKLEELEKAD